MKKLFLSVLFISIALLFVSMFMGCGQEKGKVSLGYMMASTPESSIDFFRSSPSADPEEFDRIQAVKDLTKSQLTRTYQYKRFGYGLFDKDSYEVEHPGDAVTLRDGADGNFRFVIYTNTAIPDTRYTTDAPQASK